MRSYRHSFHAGNHADVLKHTVLVAIIHALQQKPKPFVVVDTHAGAGMFDVSHAHMQKTQEYVDGIGRLWSQEGAPPAVADYIDVIRSFNQEDKLTHYPGSPSITAALLRPDDRLVAHEWHSTDFPLLQTLFQKNRQAHVFPTDGYAQLKAHLPPKERRGLVLMDPSYEIKTEYKEAIQHLVKAHNRWPTGIYALWYPVVERHDVDKMLRTLVSSGMRDILQIELCVRADTEGRGMTGSGMLVVNPPWKLGEQMRHALPWLVSHLADDGGSFSVTQLVPE